MTSSLNFPYLYLWWYVYLILVDKCLQGHCTCDMPNVYGNDHNLQSFSPRADDFGTTNVCDFVLLAKFANISRLQ